MKEGLATVAVATLGCKVNQYESAGMVEILAENGFCPVSFTRGADLYVINTCTVTGKADSDSRRLIRKALQHRPATALLVTGCYAQTAPGEIASLRGVSIVAGNEEKRQILPLARQALAGEKKTCLSDLRDLAAFSSPEVRSFPGRTRAYLKIQDGCDVFCNYCIVPYARGKSRSLPEEAVLERMTSLGGAGYREVVLTGINLGAYGRDLDPAGDLEALLGRLKAEGLPMRIRLSSLEPQEITAGLLSFLKETGGVCPHFHIPFQHGDDGILARMGRSYGGDFVRSLVFDLAAAVPDVAIGADIMVGFPGEGEKEFMQTLELIEVLPVAYLHVFPYSPRPGTPAAGLPGQVPGPRKKERVRLMRQVSAKKREAFAARFLGKELQVLLEETRDRMTGLMQGYSQNYIPVLVENGLSSSANRLVSVRCGNMHDGKLVGRIVDR